MASKPPPLDPPPPPFSRRVYHGQAFGPDELLAKLAPGEPLIIYVEAIRSEYPEDWGGELRAWRTNRAFLSNCYSVVEPEGEVGFTPLSEVQPIPEAEFRGAVAGLGAGRWPVRREG